MSENRQGAITTRVVNHRVRHKTESQLIDEVEKYSRSESRSAFLLITVLLLEAFVSLVFSEGHSAPELAAIVLTELAVALAVVGEVIYAHRADAARKELEQLSDEKVAGANRDAAMALERAAILEKEAALMRERTAEIERLTAWRRVLPEQCQIIADALRDKSVILDVLIEYERGDPESFYYARDVMRIFFESGVQTVRCNPNSFLSTIFGLNMTVAAELSAVDVGGAFTRAGIDFRALNINLSTHLPRNERAPNLYIFVAPKLPIDFAARASSNSVT